MQTHKLILITPFFLASAHPVALPKSAPVLKPQFSHTIPSIPTMPVPAMPTFQPMEPVAPPSLPVAPTGTYSNTYAPQNCTSYVASRVKVPDSWGNASNWADSARAAGITVSDTPIQGAIAQHGGGLGHVAVVLQVGDGQVLIAEQNYDYQGSIRERWATTSEFIYIYV